jgi:hypothetical protein
VSFPQDNPVFQLLHWFVDTPGIGGVSVIALILACLGTFAGALRWIVQGGRAPEASIYAYPTSTLLEHPGSDRSRTA